MGEGRTGELAGDLVDAAADLLLGSSCVGCGRAGRPLCRSCREGLPGSASSVRPDPCPDGLAAAYATGDYDAVLRALVLAHKERGLWSLGAPLGRQLARSVSAALAAAATPGNRPVVLVPVPSRKAAVRERGHDPTLAMTRRATRVPEADGWLAARLLRLRPGVADQAGLTVAERHQNLARSMAVRPRTLAALARRHPAVDVVVCDDVLTTGATAREAQRALEAVGVPVLAVATVAATRRRRKNPG